MDEPMKVIVNQEKIVELTPSLMAEVFWGMYDEQQADFFHELAVVIRGDQDPRSVTYSHGEMQWLCMTKKIKERSKEAREMFLSFSAFAYEFWPQKYNL